MALSIFTWSNCSSPALIVTLPVKRFPNKLAPKVPNNILNPIKPGGWGVFFAHSKFKFKLFLNDLWYESESLWIFLTVTEDCFAEKKNNIKLSGGNRFLYRGYCQKIGVRICRIVLVAEINKNIYKKLLVLHY